METCMEWGGRISSIVPLVTTYWQVKYLRDIRGSLGGYPLTIVLSYSFIYILLFLLLCSNSTLGNEVCVKPTWDFETWVLLGKIFHEDPNNHFFQNSNIWNLSRLRYFLNVTLVCHINNFALIRSWCSLVQIWNLTRCASSLASKCIVCIKYMPKTNLKCLVYNQHQVIKFYVG